MGYSGPDLLRLSSSHFDPTETLAALATPRAMLSFWRSVRLVAKVLCLRLGAAMRRREFIGLIGGTAAWPLAVRAQQPKKIPRVGYLAGGPPNEYADTLFRSLRELGYVDGVNIKIDVRFAYGRLELLPGLANELISLKPDVLIGGGPRSAPLSQNRRRVPFRLSGLP